MATVEEWQLFLEQLATKDSRLQRAIAIIFGALVADASGQPLHWIYKMDRLKDVLRGVDKPEFFEPSANPFYQLEVGAQSPYGDEMMVVLESLASCDGFNLEHLKKTFLDSYAPNIKSSVEYNVSMKHDPSVKLPVKTPWVNILIKHFVKVSLDQVEDTADPHNDDPDAIVCGIPLLALCAARGETLEEILVKLNSFFGHFQKQSVILSTDLLATRLIYECITTTSGIELIDLLKNVTEELRNPNRHVPLSDDLQLADHMSDVLKADQSWTALQASQHFGMA